MYAFRPLAFKIKRIAGCQYARLGFYLRRRRPMDIVEDSGFVIDVVLSVIALDLIAVEEMLEADMASRFGIAGFDVVIDGVGANTHFRGLDLDGSAQVP